MISHLFLNQLRQFLFLLILVAFSSVALADFTYSIKDPREAEAQQYVISKSNISLLTEGSNTTYWHPDVGSESRETSPPGVIIYHFPLDVPIAEANLFIRTDTYHWSYSKGESIISVSSDGQNWTQLKETLPPEYGEWNSGSYNGLLPMSFVGERDIYIKVELYSYGPTASYGGVRTNTAQHLRYDADRDNYTLKLEVKDTFSNGGISFDPNTAMLHIPCVEVGGDFYEADLRLDSEQPLALSLLHLGVTEESSNCTSFDETIGAVPIKNLFLGGSIFNFNLELRNGVFNVTNLEQAGGYSGAGQCYVGCDQPTPTESMNCAVACDGFWTAGTALINGGYPHFYHGPDSWGACAAEMNDLGISGW